MKISFEGKVALVTGASMGIGLETARAFAEAGAQVALVARSKELLDQEVKALEKAGHNAIAVPCDVSKEDQVEAMVEKTVKEFGRLDAVFNNAGVNSPAIDITELTSEEFDRVIGIDLRGAWLCMKYQLRYMRSQGSGAIVNCSSNSGVVATGGRSAYCAAKHGLVGLTMSTAIDYAPRGIRINVVCPGTIETPMVKAMVDSGDLSREICESLAPIARLGTSREVADAVLWLCSDYSSYVIGQAISVDGGYTIV